MASRLKWNGDEIKRKVLEASKHGINATMSKAAIQAKRNHPGWRNRTGTAEGSVRITKFAEPRGNIVAGQWGSIGVNYVIWLELKHGSFLRNAAAKTYPSLKGEIQRALKGF